MALVDCNRTTIPTNERNCTVESCRKGEWSNTAAAAAAAAAAAGTKSDS